MANNKTKTVTLPLKAKLNMTKNKSIVSSTFDMVEDCNSPVYGGCITPLHTTRTTSTVRQKWDKYGNSYTVYDGNLRKNGTVVFPLSKTFNVTEYKEFTYNNRVYKPAGGYFYNGAVKLYARDSWEEGNVFIVQLGNGGIGTWYGDAIRIVQDTNVMVIARYMGDGSVNCKTISYENGGTIAEWTVNLKRFDYFVSTSTNVMTSQNEGSALAIIVSASLNGGWRGVTILNHHQDGTNPYATCRFANTILHANWTVYQRDVLLGCYPQVLGADGDMIFIDDSTLIAKAAITQTGAWMGPYSSATTKTVFATSASSGNISISDSYCSFPSGARESMFNAAGARYLVAKCQSAAGLTTNQRFHRLVIAGPEINGSYLNDSGTAVTFQYGVVQMWDNMSNPAYGRSCVGAQADFTWPTTDAGWTAIWNQTQNGSATTAVYNTSGAAVNVGNWRILYNYRQGYVSGISYTNGEIEYIGTLVTPWNSVDDNAFIQVSGDSILYTDCNTKTVKAISAVNWDGNIDRVDIIDGRYVVVNTYGEQTCYDAELDKIWNWASDWNGRTIAGWNGTTNAAPDAAQLYKKYEGRWFDTGTLASGQNMQYTKTKSPTPSAQFPYQTLNKVGFGSEISYFSRTKYPVEVYTRKNSISAPQYEYSTSGNNKSTASECVNTTYPVSSSSSVVYNLPIVGVKYIQGYTGRFGVEMGNNAYTIQYDGIRPIASYNSLSMLENVQAYFIVQSQYYAVADNYIVAVNYNSSGGISSVEQIVDVTGMEFIGAFPSVAYFWSPSTHSIFAFTGDADLQLFVQSNRLNTVYNHLYAPNNEWIYIATNDGIYVMTQMNIFRISDIVDSNIRMYATDEKWNVLEYSNGSVWVTDKLQIDKTSTTLPVHYRTAYLGPGDMKTATIDCWYIRLYKGDEDDNKTIYAKVHTLNDTTFVSGEQEWTITKDMWDDNDTCFIRYQPQYQLAQGVALEITSPYPVASVGFSIQEEGVAQVSQLNI